MQLCFGNETEVKCFSGLPNRGKELVILFQNCLILCVLTSLVSGYQISMSHSKV